MNKGLSMSIIFEGNSLNYGEGIANISELKKIHRRNGQVFTFVSRQALRYDIVRFGNELYGWNLDTVDKASGVVQFRKDVTIKDSVEMDLFGYLKTDKESKKRPAVVRLSHGISLEPYRSDMEFLNNMGLAERINENPNLANIEQHQSLYSYTVSIDLAKVGVDQNDQLEIPKEEKANRIIQFLEILKILNRNIRGRQENLSPLFLVGGIYPIANPFFLGKVKIDNKKEDAHLIIDTIKDVMNQKLGEKAVKDFTWIGLLEGVFANQEEIKEAFKEKVLSVEEFFQTISHEVKEFFGVS